MGSLRRWDELGDTLVELLIAIVIIAVAAVALISALTTGISASAEHRSLAVEDTVLKSTAETMKDDLQKQGSFKQCAATSDYASFLPAATSGYTQPTMTIEYWNTTSSGFVDDSAATCTSTAADQSGIQLITLTVNTIPDKVTQSLAFVVRAP